MIGVHRSSVLEVGPIDAHAELQLGLGPPFISRPRGHDAAGEDEGLEDLNEDEVVITER